MTTVNDNLYSAAVNNFGIDPLQGFDVELWVQHQGSGQIAWFGKFQSITISLRNATETYLELGQRMPIYLDGEIQIAWVLEQGLVDMNFVQRTFGINEMTRDRVIGRGPRFQIAFDCNAEELAVASTDSYREPFQRTIGQMTSNLYPTTGITGTRARGRYELQRCKVDSVSMGAMPGRRVIALRWEGVAEGIRYVNTNISDPAGASPATVTRNRTTLSPIVRPTT